MDQQKEGDLDGLDFPGLDVDDFDPKLFQVAYRPVGSVCSFVFTFTAVFTDITTARQHSIKCLETVVTSGRRL